MNKIIFFVLIAIVSGCSIRNSKSVCQQWIEQGELATSMERCIRCAKKSTPRDVHQVRACVFKSDIGDIRDSL